MRAILRDLAVSIFGVLALFPVSARADLSTRLVEELSTPVIRFALGATPEGRALADRMAGENMLLTPARPDAWREQSERMVRGLMQKQAPGTADQVYSRLVRFGERFRAEAPADSNLAAANGSRDVSFDEFDLAQRLAAEELSLRTPTLMERLRGVSAELNGRIEFAPGKDGADFSSDRETFLRGHGGT